MGSPKLLGLPKLHRLATAKARLSRCRAARAFRCASPRRYRREHSSRPRQGNGTIFLFEHDLRANASCLSRGKTGTHPSGRGPRACFSGSCSRSTPLVRARERHVAWRKWIATALVPVIAVALAGYFRPDRAIRVATGAVADSVCARTFVSGLDPQAVFAETMDRPGIRRLRWLMRYQLDRAAKTVDASVIGLLGSRAAFHDGFGCVLLRGSNAPYLLKSDVEALKVPKNPPLLPELAGRDIVQPSDPELKAALDHAFEEPAEPPFRRTKAVVVVHEGSVIAERYAPGVRVDTQLVGFSMTKSVVNALLGILTQQGLISPSLPAPIPEWRGANDPRREIEVEHLMRMTTGLALDETNTGFDPSNQMYLYGDMAGFAVTAPMIAPPGTRWHYSSATTQLLARIVRDAVGGPEQTLAFAWRELFNP